MSIYVALLAGCVLTMILGKFVLAELRKLKAGQEIRQDGPTWHNSKAGTPTMGGIAFILGLRLAADAGGGLRPSVRVPVRPDLRSHRFCR